MVQTAGTRVDIGALTTGQPPWWRERRRAHSLECVKAGEGREKGGKTKKGFAKKRNKAANLREFCGCVSRFPSLQQQEVFEERERGFMSSGFRLLTGAPRKLWISSESLLLCMQTCPLHQRKIQCLPVSSMRLRSKRVLGFCYAGVGALGLSS
ncbi:hypothetical protein AAG906_013858 [Vitis piasezkii]